MKLFVYRHPSGVRNFGDELGADVFPRLLPGVFNDDDRTLFLGIGSILFDFMPADATKIVLGAGYGGYTSLPSLDSSWRVYGVRGPLTCRALGLDPALGIGDPAILLDDTPYRACPKRFRASFMPHWQSMERGDWLRVSEMAGVNLIDPRAPVSEVLHAIAASDVLLAEAMHGAIVADALRVPWIALRPLDPVHRFKWHDWAESLAVTLRPQRLAASTLGERLDVTRIGRRAPWRRIRRALPGISRLAQTAFAESAAQSLGRALRSEPCLSHDAMLSKARMRINDAVDAFRRDFANART